MAVTEMSKPEAAQRDDGRTRDARLGDAPGAEGSRAASILTTDDFRRIGRACNGVHWQADVASEIGVSRSQITRYLNGDRIMSPLTARHLQFVIVEHITALAHLFEVSGMPHAGTEAAKTARDAILGALKRVPGQEPPRDD